LPSNEPTIHFINVPKIDRKVLKQLCQTLLQERNESLQALRCAVAPVGCGREISPEEFAAMDLLTLKEYGTSALCSTCQDEFFGQDDEDDPMYPNRTISNEEYEASRDPYEGVPWT
jgi:hypothetical protein